MSISILLLSIVFALIEAGLTWLLLAFQPVAELVAGMPVWLLSGVVFSLGMLLSFIVIIIVGALEIGPRAASFVRDHFGRTVLLGLLSIALAFVLAMGGEALYHVDPIAPVEKVEVVAGNADVCFVLDYSSSMRTNNDDVSMKTAFAQVINGLPDGQRVCVVRYESAASVLQSWTVLDAGTRAAVIQAVQNEQPSGGTVFEDALRLAGDMAEQAISQGRGCAVIMLSDGQDSINSVAVDAPKLIQYQVPVYTMYAGNPAGANVSTLQQIASETGGEMTTSTTDLTNLTTNLIEITNRAANAQVAVVENDFIPDTLLTERDPGREGLFNIAAMRMVVLFIICFVFKLVCVICVGNNSRFLGHFLHAFFIALLAAAAVEFGYALGLPVILVAAAFWILMMGQIVLTNR